MYTRYFYDAGKHCLIIIHTLLIFFYICAQLKHNYMKKILFIIMLASLFACSKDNEKTKEKDVHEITQEAFNALIGKWQFSRASEDKDFANLIDPELTENDKGNYIQFFADSTFICKYYDGDYVDAPNRTSEGPFRITLFHDMPSIDMSANGAGLVVKIKTEYLRLSGVYYLTYTQNTFSFIREAYNGKPTRYIEYKRVQ